MHVDINWQKWKVDWKSFGCGIIKIGFLTVSQKRKDGIYWFSIY